MFVSQNRKHEVALSLIAINHRLLWLVVVVKLINVTGLMMVDICYRRALRKFACDYYVILNKSIFF